MSEGRIEDWTFEPDYPENKNRPWYEKRLPFNVEIAVSLGSTMFDFCFWKLPEVLSLGIFWVHLDIQVSGMR